MGRKGVSIRKPGKTKLKPMANDNAGSSVTTVLRETNQPARSLEKKGTIPSTDRKKKP